jgi:photosystem II stability/assembly factor-like uncharacterized protein
VTFSLPARRRSSVAALTLTLLAVPLASPAARAIDPPVFDALSWRLVGPFRAGWSTCALGVPERPDTYYFGAAGGGVWRSDDSGRTWRSLFDHQGSASIGALAVAPSNPEVIYAGTGQVEPRYDLASGDGVYRSDNGGATWRHVGLAETQHIGAIWVDPRAAGTVVVAAQGHFFAPNPERGIYRSEDGGASWTQALAVDASTGAVDLAADPALPDTLYAALWQVQRHPWQDYYMPATGPGSGIYKSTDGGRSWARVAGAGLPRQDLGRIGLAVADGTGARRVYALVDAGQQGGLYRSDDGGATWQWVNHDPGLGGYYFARLTVEPHQPETVYLTGQSIRRSTDGGKTLEFYRGAPGGDDFHFLWINPRDPARRVAASDQGTIVSVNGGASWSSWYNQPTGQFYHVETDDRFPYWIYSGQQDSGTAALASRSDYGELTFRDWHPAGGDERGYVVPESGDPRIAYTGGLGGRVSRYDERTGRAENVAPWPLSTYARPPYDAEWRYTWYWPLVRAPHAARTLYLGSQKVWKTEDGGDHWHSVSPDLTGQTLDPQDEKLCPRPIPFAKARDCGYGVVFSIAPSTVDAQLIWAGSDSGLVHLTRDGGATWKDVTPSGLPAWSKVSMLEASPSDPATAWAAVDRHRLDDRRPHVYVTHDFGATWTETVAGLPATAFVYAVREDPVDPRLIFAATHVGVFVSFDGATSWQSLQGNLPTTDVTDATIHGSDLVLATQGRGIWVLDDFAALRELAGAIAAAKPALFPPEPAYRLRPNENRDTPIPQEEPMAANPPAGAILDYYLPAASAQEVRLEILDANGTPVRAFSSRAAPEALDARQYFTALWLAREARPAAGAGLQRFLWDLRGPRPASLDYDFSIAATPFAGAAIVPQGPLVPPGRYQARLTVGGASSTRDFEVRADPRLPVVAADLASQSAFYREIAAALARVVSAHERLPAAPAATAGEKPKKAEAERRQRVSEARGELEKLSSAMTSILADLESADSAPTDAERSAVARLAARLDAAERSANALAAAARR